MYKKGSVFYTESKIEVGRSLGYQDKGTVQVREGHSGQVAGGENVQRGWPTKLEIVWGW